MGSACQLTAARRDQVAVQGHAFQAPAVDSMRSLLAPREARAAWPGVAATAEDDVVAAVAAAGPGCLWNELAAS